MGIVSWCEEEERRWSGYKTKSEIAGCRTKEKKKKIINECVSRQVITILDVCTRYRRKDSDGRKDEPEARLRDPRSRSDTTNA